MWRYLTLTVVLSLQQLAKGQEFAYFRCNNVTKTLQFVYIGDLTFYDIYAESRASTCGLRAGVVTGRGIFSDPYILEINLSSGLVYQQPDCGVKQSADFTVNLVVIKQKTCESNSSTDQRYVSNCRITLPPSNFSSVIGQVSYYCVFPSYIKFVYQQSSLELTPPADIYAINKKGTCSKSVGSGTGQGIDGSPFEIRIDVTNSLLDCGVMNTEPGVYSVLIYIQQYTAVLTKYDSTYLLSCNFSVNTTITLQSQVITVVSHTPTQVITERNTTASLSVVSGTGSIGLTSFIVGDQIRLVAQLLDSPATGLRITSCTASPGLGMKPVIQVLNSKGCSTQPVLVLPFVGQSPSGMVAMTGIFNAFKFEATNTVFFQCNASLCYDGDLRCYGNHCTSSVRRKRETSEETYRVLGVTLTVKDNMTSTVQEHIINSEAGPTSSSGDDQYNNIVGTPRRTLSGGSPHPFVDWILLIIAIASWITFIGQ